MRQADRVSLGRSRLPLVRVEGSAVFLGGVYPVESDSLRYSGQFEVGGRTVALHCPATALISSRDGVVIMSGELGPNPCPKFCH